MTTQPYRMVTGMRVRLTTEQDTGALYIVTGRRSDTELTLRRPGTPEGEYTHVPADAVVPATHGDATYMRHCWPIGSRVRRQGADRVYDVVAHEPHPGRWFGTLRIRPADAHNETSSTLLCLSTADAVLVNHPP